MWSKNGTPVVTSVRPLPSRTSVIRTSHSRVVRRTCAVRLTAPPPAPPVASFRRVVWPPHLVWPHLVGLPRRSGDHHPPRPRRGRRGTRPPPRAAPRSPATTP